MTISGIPNWLKMSAKNMAKDVGKKYAKFSWNPL